MADQPTVTDIFNRALEIRKGNPDGSLDDLKAELISEFSGKQCPHKAYLIRPEYVNVARVEDWTAGLPVVLRGIHNEDWNDIALGIVISLEQVENYPKESGREDDPAKEWRNRGKSIAGEDEKVLKEWMPEELMAMANKEQRITNS